MVELMSSRALRIKWWVFRFTKAERKFNQLVVDTEKKRKRGHVFIELLRFSMYELESSVFAREYILGKIVRNHPALQVRRNFLVPSP